MRWSLRRACVAVALTLLCILYVTFDRFLKHQQTLVVPAASPNLPPNPVAKGEIETSIWPDLQNKWDDRIVTQLNYVPETYNEETAPSKVIYLPDGEDLPMGRTKFIDDKCLVNKCSLSMDANVAKTADAVVLKSTFYAESRPPRFQDQIWIYYQLESPVHTSSVDALNNYINWTATYRYDSTLVTPYEKFVPFTNVSSLRPQKDYSQGKTKLVAWFVSNCGASNHRQDYVAELQKYISVDIFGSCGDHQCSRSDRNVCNELLSRTYKFYLAFENSNCKYYITEKLFWNALLNDIVPVVLGARKLDYIYAAPPKSFIYAGDFESPRALASYLLELDKDPVAYNSYLAWKGRGEYVNTKFWCRVCALLHSPTSTVPRYYRNLDKWWRGTTTCNTRNWDDETSFITDWASVW